MPKQGGHSRNLFTITAYHRPGLSERVIEILEQWFHYNKVTHLHTCCYKIKFSPLKLLIHLNELRPGKCTKCKACFQHHPCRAIWSLSSVHRESTYAVSKDKPSVAQTLWALPTHTSYICLQCSSLPKAQLNKWAQIDDHLHLVWRLKLDTEETCKQRKPK